MKYFIVVFDRVPTGNYTRFHSLLVPHPRIKKWWHYLQSSYIIGTDMTASELSSHVRDAFKGAQIVDTHLVIKLDLRKRQGMLTAKAWEWFKAAASSQDPLG